MKIKSYFARTVESAVTMARQELGPDAMLVNSRKAPPESGHLGVYEVVFATEAPRAEPAAAMAGTPGPSVSPAPQPGISLEVADLKKELEAMRRAITRSAFAPAQWMGASPDLSDAYAVLTASDVSPELARDIVHCAESRITEPRVNVPRGALPRKLQRVDPAAFQSALVEEMESRFTVQPELGKSDAKPRIVALMGPPGAGKTATLVKLAVNYGLVSRRPVLLLSMDTYRVGAAEQLRSFATILGVGFEVLQTVTALAQTIEENRGKELIFIDTPGFGFADIENSAGLAHFLSTRPDIDKHLVLSASMKSADLTRMVDCYEVFRPERLLFTKLDETASFGPLLNEAARTGKALSFFAAGQRIPEDLEAASLERLSGLILTGLVGQRSAA